MKTKPKILIVEDERITAEDIQRTLKYLGYAVSSIASSARDAIQKVDENKPDLILMDIKLRGDMDGVEATRRIHSRFDIPVVYITGMTEEATLQRAKKTNPFGYIHKPIEEKELYTTIEMALYRYKMGRKLKESEERYRQSIENSPNPIFSVDREGIIQIWNQACKQVFQYGAEEIIGQTYHKLLWNSKHRSNIESMLARVWQGNALSHYDMSYRCKDGTQRFTISRLYPLHNHEGKVHGCVFANTDITERKQAEQEKKTLQAQLVQSEKMAGIGTLAGGIAHEFNNLFQIIRGHSEFAQKTERQEDIEEAFDTIISKTDKAAKIIRDLLTFSSQEPSEREPCDITELIESVLLLIEEQLEKHNIKVVRKYGGTPQIEVNKGEMRQVFLNMVMNARDVMLPEGGRLGIIVRRVKKNVEISISDTGKGIEKEDLGKVFEPFYTTKGAIGGDSNHQGTGLGLSVSYGIVKRHGGTIEVQSKVGKGTTFTVKLPVKGGETEEQSAEAGEKKEMRKTKPLNILAVDDEEEICNMFTKWLSAEGHRVESALTGKKAINLVKMKYFDIVFLDIVMPGIPAVEVLEKIKKISPKTKVAMMTGKLIDKDLMNEFKQKGASAFLQKPFKIEDIAEFIKA